MHNTTVTVTEVVRNFSEYINRIAYRHENFILVKGKKPVAELKPLPLGRTLADLPEMLASLPSLTRDEAEAFSADILHARESPRGEGLRDLCRGRAGEFSYS